MAVVIREFGPPEVLEACRGWLEATAARAGTSMSARRPARWTWCSTAWAGTSDWRRSALLGAGGRFCPFGMASGSFTPVTPDLARARQVTVRAGAGASPEELAALVRTALAEAAAGRLRAVIGQEFELAEAVRAHAAIEARTTVGKTLLIVPR